jgi:hypothetical protein
MAAMNVSVNDAAAMAYGIQHAWLAGNMSRFDIVDYFLMDMLGEEDSYEEQRIESFLPRLKILVTSKGKGVEIVQPATRSELQYALKQTTWIPFVTGEGVMRPLENYNSTTGSGSVESCSANNDEADEFYIDGGFSRVLHPICEFDLRVPNTWVNMLYTLHPGISREQVNLLWEAGQKFDHPLLLASR